MSEPKSAGVDSEAVLERIERCLVDTSLGFERWDDPHARGPGLYFVVERDTMAEYTVPMGRTRWPVENCGNVCADPDGFRSAAEDVASSQDGAVVVHSDRTIEEPMVRVTQLFPADDRGTDERPDTEWIGTRHMSALETSTRNEVIAAVTLSEEDGRVTVFSDGTFEECRYDGRGE